MRRYKIRSLVHLVYEPEDELPQSLNVVEDWRDGHVSDWVKTNDDCVIQVLRRGQMLRSKGRDKIREYIGTCTGTFPIGPRIKMDTSKRANIYSFGGSKSPDNILLDRQSLTKAEQVFVLYFSQGTKPEDAYLKVLGRVAKTDQLPTLDMIIQPVSVGLENLNEQLKKKPNFWRRLKILSRHLILKR